MGARSVHRSTKMFIFSPFIVDAKLSCVKIKNICKNKPKLYISDYITISYTIYFQYHEFKLPGTVPI